MPDNERITYPHERITHPRHWGIVTQVFDSHLGTEIDIELRGWYGLAGPELPRAGDEYVLVPTDIWSALVDGASANESLHEAGEV